MKEADKIFQLVETVKQCENVGITAFLKVGEIMVQIQEEKLWKWYGDHLRTFDDFLMDVGYKRSTVYQRMDIWRTFGKYLTSKQLDISYMSLVKALPVAEEDPKGWIEKAIALPPNSFEDEVRIAKGLQPHDSCAHKNTYDVPLVQCRDCGLRYKKD